MIQRRKAAEEQLAQVKAQAQEQSARNAAALDAAIKNFERVKTYSDNLKNDTKPRE